MTDARLPGAIVRYLIGGGAGLAVGIGVTAAAREGLGLPVGWAFAAALAAVFAFHFVSNARFVFRTGAGPRTLARYTASAAAFRGVDFVVFTGLVERTGLYYPVAIVLAMSISNAVKFLVYRRYVFVDPARTGAGVPAGPPLAGRRAGGGRTDGPPAADRAPAAGAPGGRR